MCTLLNLSSSTHLHKSMLSSVHYRKWSDKTFLCQISFCWPTMGFQYTSKWCKFFSAAYLLFQLYFILRQLFDIRKCQLLDLSSHLAWLSTRYVPLAQILPITFHQVVVSWVCLLHLSLLPSLHCLHNLPLFITWFLTLFLLWFHIQLSIWEILDHWHPVSHERLKGYSQMDLYWLLDNIHIHYRTKLSYSQDENFLLSDYISSIWVALIEYLFYH